MPRTPPLVAIGTSGWHYPRGRGAWSGIVYPPVRRGSRFDELAYYAARFRTVEVNVSFYRPLSEAMTRGWVERTPDGFTFAVKLHQTLTHAAGLAPRGAEGPQVPDVDAAEVASFLAPLRPLEDADRLGPLLAQFPAGFHASPETFAYLEWLLEALRDRPVAVELRHRSWSDARGDLLRLLDAAGAAWVLIDEPKFSSSVYQGVELARAQIGERPWGYVRLHGRNAAQWWDPETSEDRYDYLYSEAELMPFADLAEAAQALGRKLYLYANNHFGGKAVANAAQLRAALDDPVTEPFPPAFGDRFPGIEKVVRIERRDTLF
jgi:uncharacterized protein YecE (DUF72 family)